MRSIRFGLAAIGICGLVALGGRVQVLWWEQQTGSLANQQEALGDQIIALRNVMDTLVDLETGQRGYLLTGDDDYLRPYRAGAAALDENLRRLSGLFAEDPGMQAQIESIAQLARAKESELSRTVELRRKGDPAGALAIVETGEGRRLMEEFRDKTGALTAQFRQERAAVVALEQERFRQVTTLGAIVILLIILLVATAVAWLSLSLRGLDALQQAREREAMHDALTGLPNRRYLTEWLKGALATAERGKRRLALLYLDLDGFKAINDRFGHEAGDRVLQATATRLRQTVRASDFVARLGGDEFIAVLPDAPEPADLSALLERLQGILSKAAIPETVDGAVTASIGIASYPQDGNTADALLSAGDRAMYEVKARHHGARSAGPPQGWPDVGGELAVRTAGRP